jgi:hypothetical protein
MKKTILTLLTCLSFNSLSAEFLDREWQLTSYLYEMIDVSQEQCDFIEQVLPEDCTSSKSWNYHQGRIDAYNDILYWFEFMGGLNIPE